MAEEIIDNTIIPEEEVLTEEQELIISNTIKGMKKDGVPDDIISKSFDSIKEEVVEEIKSFAYYPPPLLFPSSDDNVETSYQKEERLYNAEKRKKIDLKLKDDSTPEKIVESVKELDLVKIVNEEKQEEVNMLDFLNKNNEEFAVPISTSVVKPYVYDIDQVTITKKLMDQGMYYDEKSGTQKNDEDLFSLKAIEERKNYPGSQEQYDDLVAEHGEGNVKEITSNGKTYYTEDLGLATVWNTSPNLRNVVNFAENIIKVGVNLTDPNERKQLWQETKNIWHNIPLNFQSAYYSTKLATNEMMEGLVYSSFKNNMMARGDRENSYDEVDALILLDIVGGNWGFSFENPWGTDNSETEQLAGVEWIDPKGKRYDIDYVRDFDYKQIGLVRSDVTEDRIKNSGITRRKDDEYYKSDFRWEKEYKDLQELSNERKKNGWKVIYKSSGKEVGYKYKTWQLSQFGKIIELEAKKIIPNVSFVNGYKQHDASQFFGAGVLSVSSLIETMLPAILTRGVSLYPQIVTPKYVQFNREKAKAIYPNLPELEAINRLLEEEQQEVLTPLVIGFVEMALEKIGIKGITSAIKTMKPGAMQFVSNVVFSGSREGMTEWSQLGTTIINREVARLNGIQVKRVNSGHKRNMTWDQIYARAGEIAWTAMTSEEGLENFLMGLVGGSFATTSGAIINRAMRMDPSSITFVNQKIREIANLRKRASQNYIKSEKVKEALQAKIDKILEELKVHIKTSKKLSGWLTKEEKEKLIGYNVKGEKVIGLVDKHGNIKLNIIDLKIEFFLNYEINGQTIEELAKEAGISSLEYLRLNDKTAFNELNILLEKENNDLNKVLDEIDEIKQNANERMINAGLDENQVVVKGKGGEIVVFETEQDLREHLNKNKGKKGYSLKETDRMKKADGFQVGNNIYINKHIAINVGAVSVVQHETAHFLFGQHFHDVNGDITPEGLKVIKKFKNSLSDRTKILILGRLVANNYNLDDLNTQEEFLTMYIDGVVKGDFDATKKSMTIIGGALTGIMKNNGYKNIKFNNWQDVLTWLEDYVQGAQGTEKKTKPTKQTKPKYSLTDLKPKTNSFVKTDQTTFNNSGVNNVVEYLYGKLDGLIMKYVSSEVKRLDDFKQEDYLQDTYIQLIKHIKTFKVAEYNEDGTRKLNAKGEKIGNDDLFGFIVAYTEKKGGNVTKKLDFNFVQRLDDENSFIDDIESEEFINLEVAIEEDVTFSKLRKILGIEKGSALYKKIIEAVKTVIPGEILEVNTPAFKKALAKYFQDKFFDDIKALIGGSSGKQTYKDFIINNAKALYDVFSQQVFNKSFQDFIIKTETNISPTRVDEAIREGLLPKGTPRTSGPDLFTKLPWNEDTQKKWVDNFLNPTKGRPASKQNSLIEALSLIIGLDAVMEIINSKEFLANNKISDATIATIGLKIDRGANVRFSKTDGSTINLTRYSFSTIDAGKMVRYVEDFIGMEEKGLDFILQTGFPKTSQETRDFVALMYSKGYIANSESTRFKVQIAKDKDISDATKKKIRDVKNLRYHEDALDDLYDQAVIICTALGPKIMKVIGYDFFGFINRVMDSAELKESGLSGKFYEKLEDLKTIVENSENITLPEGLNLSKIRLMNKKYKLFKAIEKILFDGDSKIDGSNIKWKKAELAKLSVQIKEAGKANIMLAKLLAKTLITTSNDDASIIQLLQIQTSIVSGFRALTTLDLITVLEGSQEPGKSHPYFQMELDIAKKAVHGPKHKDKELRGKPKYPTEELAIAAAITALGTKGEHAAANANTMAKIANLRARYLKDKSIDLDGELDKIFANHGQIHTTKGVAKDMDDVGGPTNAMDWFRVMLTDLRKDMFGFDGKTAEEVVIDKESQSVRFSINSDFNDMLERTQNVKSKSIFSEAQARMRGSKIVKFWDFVYPPSAYDLEIFLYRMIGKGKQGMQDLEFFRKTLFNPYNEAYTKINKEAQKIKSQYKNLLKKLPKVKKSLKKKVAGTNFTVDQAVRVAIWTDMGVNMQELGLSKKDQKTLVDYVNNSVELKKFKEALKGLPLKKGGYVLPSEYWTVESIASDIDQGVNKFSRAKHLENWKNNAEQIFSEDNKRKLRAIYGNNFVDSLEDMLYRMEFGKGKGKPTRIESMYLNWVNNSVGAIMFFNMRSAVLQVISAANYIDWSDNNIVKAALAFANLPQYMKDFVYIFNSDYLKERRSGNKQDINMAELTTYLKAKDNKAKAIIAFLLEKGFTPTQVADSFAISSGGATYYRNKVKAYLKQGFSKQEAEEKAWTDFVDKTEKGQQSSRPDNISEQQAGGLGKLILAFKNTPMQYNRLMIKAILDLKNGRGSTRENLSKIAYYGFVQNLIFGSLQSALFAALGDDDEWDTKKQRVANGMIDTILNGLGLTGAVAVTLKNSFLVYRKQNKKGWNADHTYTILQFANFSPTIGSKLRKLYSSITTEKYNIDAIEEMGFDIENPAFNSLASLISALTNIPMDRAVQKTQNIILSSKSETEVWDKVALLLGWNPWDLNIETTAKKVKKDIDKREKAKKKQCTAIKSKGGRCNNKTTNKSGKCYAHDK